MRILLVEDDKDLRELVSLQLNHAGYETDVCGDGEDGIYYAENTEYDVILLDRMLPALEGTEVLRRLRKKGIMTPVIMVTALDEVHDRVNGLDAGADDYLVKPFEMEELFARIRAVLRRPRGFSEKRTLSYGDLTYEPSELTLRCCEREKKLSRKEGALMEYFIQNGGQVLLREQILSRVWGIDSPVEDGNVDNYIYFLRRRLKGLGSFVAIKTIHGVGYRMEENHAS